MREETSTSSTARGGRAAARALGLAALVMAAGVAGPRIARADPIIVPTFDGQFGTFLKNGELVPVANFFVFSAGLTEVSYSLRIVDTSGSSAPGNDTETPFVDVEKDVLHQTQSPVEIDERTTSYDTVDKGVPAVAPWLDPDDDLAGVFSFAQDGSLSGTEGVVVAIVPTTPGAPDYIILDNINTFLVADELFAKTAVAADAQGNITVAFTEFSEPAGGTPKVRAQRLDKDGALIGDFFDITDDIHAAPEVALLDPNGDVLVITSVDLVDARIKGNLVDTTGPAPVVGAEFPISGPPVSSYIRPAVAADVNTGVFTVAWDDVTGISGNPGDVKARRFSAAGVPLGPEFTVNTTTDDAQGQSDVAYGPSGESAIVWAGDPLPAGGDLLEVFLQVYDPSGQPIGGEIQVNTFVTGVQDRPQVRFLEDPDSQGRVQFTVAWRDVASDVNNTPNGTGVSYKCFSIDEQVPIFEDGFESGDTSSWSASIPN